MWAIPAVIAMVGTAISTIGEHRAAKSEEKYNKRVEQQQQQIATDQATQKAEAVRRRGEDIASTQEAGAGGAGVVGRSLVDVMFDSYRETALGAQDEEYQGKLGVHASKLRAQQFGFQSKLRRQAATNKAIGEGIGAIGKAFSASPYGQSLGGKTP